MKLKLISDVHEEFRYGTGYFKLELPRSDLDQDTTLVIAGDLNKYTDKLIESLLDWSEQFKAVIFVLGNHDYWSHCIDDRADRLKEKVEHVSNIYILDNESVTLEGVHIWGGTFWSDAGRDPTKEYELLTYYNDFHMIDTFDEGMGRKRDINVLDMTRAFQHAKFNLVENFLRNEELTGIKVVVTHTAPSENSSLPIFKDSAFNSCFWTDMSDVLQEHRLEYWMHGHMHNSSDYEIHGTRVLCNPVGYVTQHNRDFDPKFLLEI